MATIEAHAPTKVWRVGERAAYKNTLLCRVMRVFPGLRHEDTRVKVQFTDEIDRIVPVGDLSIPYSVNAHDAEANEAA